MCIIWIKQMQAVKKIKHLRVIDANNVTETLRNCYLFFHNDAMVPFSWYKLPTLVKIVILFFSFSLPKSKRKHTNFSTKATTWSSLGSSCHNSLWNQHADLVLVSAAFTPAGCHALWDQTHIGRSLKDQPGCHMPGRGIRPRRNEEWQRG